MTWKAGATTTPTGNRRTCGRCGGGSEPTALLAAATSPNGLEQRVRQRLMVASRPDSDADCRRRTERLQRPHQHSASSEAGGQRGCRRHVGVDEVSLGWHRVQAGRLEQLRELLAARLVLVTPPSDLVLVIEAGGRGQMGE